MGIVTDKPTYTKTQQRVMHRFEEAFNAILQMSYNHETGTNYVADYLRELDAKSSTTFNHSIRVAANVFRELSNDGRFSRPEILAYTRAALLHDVGKLKTKDEVLHSTHSLRPGKYIVDKKTGEKIYNQDYVRFNHMMQHSLDGIKKAQELGFSKEDIFVSIAHHVSHSCLEGASEEQFKNANYSRDSWEIKNGKEFVDNLLKKNCSWITEKDVQALEVISFYDVVEAVRANDRAYMEQKDWGSPLDEDLGECFYNSRKKMTVADILKKNMTPKKVEFSEKFELVDNHSEVFEQPSVILQDLSSQFERFLDVKEWEKLKADFNNVKSIPIIDMVRDKVTDYFRNLPIELQNERKVVLTNTRLNEVKENPVDGRAFFEEMTTSSGQILFALNDERLDKPIVFLPKAPEPDFNKDVVDIDSIRFDEEREGVSLEETQLELGDLEEEWEGFSFGEEE